ncbi:hypothetical protein ACCO45_011943 [Purpureocillium lilacinum]|uniref:Uncharacterized protein n=1 Tax=Purpureocillium lilacinum TaxID=33203 RepID=A0ACC4DDS3_PURLI
MTSSESHRLSPYTGFISSHQATKSPPQQQPTHTTMNVDKKGLYNLRAAPVPDTLIAFPRPHVLLVTLSRPAHLNAVTRAQHAALHQLWTWFDAEPWLRCAVVTGGGGARAFSAGADLKEWDGQNERGERTAETRDEGWAEGGFGGLSNRRGKKPVLAAVNGLCLGGAMEMVLNADMVLAREGATFGLPERAGEMALLGRTDYTAEEMKEWGIVNRVVRASSSPSTPGLWSSPSSTRGASAKAAKKLSKEQQQKQKQQQKEADLAAANATVEEALRWAATMAAECSPDSVIVSREGLLGGWEAEDPQASTRRVEAGVYRRMDGGITCARGACVCREEEARVEG